MRCVFVKRAAAAACRALKRGGPAVLLWASLACTGGAAQAASSGAAPMQFDTPEQAATALAEAWQRDSQAALLSIFGPHGWALISSGDPQAEHEATAKLAAAYTEEHHFDLQGSQRVVIVLGAEAWPYPIPLVRRGTQWHFDVEEGAQQIIDRRVGRNELHAIAVCNAFVAAQRDYVGRDFNRTQHEYAARVASHPGRHDGLYWKVAEGATESPLGPLVAAAEAEHYGVASAEGNAPFEGYYYRILTRQGPHAPGGARDYEVNGHLTGGFALLAFPAKYRDSGVKTFIVNQDGIVFEKDLGPLTRELARQIMQYDPDTSWNPAQP